MSKRRLSGGRKRLGSMKRRTVRKRSSRVSRPKTRSSSRGSSRIHRRSMPATSAKSRTTSNTQRQSGRGQLRRRSSRPFNPLPSAPRRVHIGGPAVVGASGAAAERQMRADQVRRQFASLEASSQLSNIYKAIGHLDSRLTALPLELDELRKRGYAHAGQLEDKIAVLDAKWDEVRPRVEQALQSHVRLLDSDLDQARRFVANMGRNAGTISTAESTVSGLTQKISAAQQAVTNLFSGFDEQVDEVDEAMDRVDWMLDQFEDAKIGLREAEGPLAVAQAEWHKDGNEGPDGWLFLTDQRLLFEQHERIATKKIFGLIATQSETIQKILLEVEVKDIDHYDDLEEKHGIFGGSPHEILELTLNATAPVSRARFRLLRQDSAAWALLINRALSGEVDEDRAEEFIAELSVAESIAASFPKSCPNCFASLPNVQRGITNVTCDYCSSVIKGIVPATDPPENQ